MKVEWHEAHPKNFRLGRTGRVDRVVLHVAEGTYSGTLAWFQNPAAGVSAHFTVAADGRVGQSVSEKNTAFHAGPVPDGHADMNSRSIGIEHEGRQNAVTPWKPTEAQLNATAELVAGICQRWNIPVDRTHIIGHNEVFPGRAARANCPGRGWPWADFLERARGFMVLPPAPKPAKVPTAPPEPGKRTVRLMRASTNTAIGTGSLVGDTDKVYLTEEMIEQLRSL